MLSTVYLHQQLTTGGTQFLKCKFHLESFGSGTAVFHLNHAHIARGVSIINTSETPELPEPPMSLRSIVLEHYGFQVSYNDTTDSGWWITEKLCLIEVGYVSWIPNNHTSETCPATVFIHVH